MELVTLATSFHSTSEDFQSMLVSPKYCLVVRLILWKLGWETNSGMFWAYSLMEDHQSSFYAIWPPTGTYPSSHHFFSPQPVPSLYTPHSFAFGNFHLVFLTAFHSGLPSIDPWISSFSFSFTFGYQFQFVIGTCDAVLMVYKKDHQKRFLEQLFFFNYLRSLK